MIKIENANESLVISVQENEFGDLDVVQGDDLIYVYREDIKLFVAAVRAVATDMLGEEV